jgi:ribosomal protein S18 acetylase RimI-like enzyme
MVLIGKHSKHINFPLKLYSFKKNDGAINFYKKIGYKTVGEDEHFFDLTKAVDNLCFLL